MVSKTIVPPGTVGSNPTPSALEAQVEPHSYRLDLGLEILLHGPAGRALETLARRVFASAREDQQLGATGFLVAVYTQASGTKPVWFWNVVWSHNVLVPHGPSTA